VAVVEALLAEQTKCQALTFDGNWNNTKLEEKKKKTIYELAVSLLLL
jgi:hypothetical protein